MVQAQTSGLLMLCCIHCLFVAWNALQLLALFSSATPKFIITSCSAYGLLFMSQGTFKHAAEARENTGFALLFKTGDSSMCLTWCKLSLLQSFVIAQMPSLVLSMLWFLKVACFLQKRWCSWSVLTVLPCFVNIAVSEIIGAPQPRSRGYRGMSAWSLCYGFF